RPVAGDLRNPQSSNACKKASSNAKAQLCASPPAAVSCRMKCLPDSLPRAGFINRFWVGHGFTACGKSHKCPYRRGRAALQCRVSPLKSAWALAPEGSAFRAEGSNQFEEKEKVGTGHVNPR